MFRRGASHCENGLDSARTLELPCRIAALNKVPNSAILGPSFRSNTNKKVSDCNDNDTSPKQAPLRCSALCTTTPNNRKSGKRPVWSCSKEARCRNHKKYANDNLCTHAERGCPFVLALNCNKCTIVHSGANDSCKRGLAILLPYHCTNCKNV